MLASVICKALVTNASDFRRLWEGDEDHYRRRRHQNTDVVSQSDDYLLLPQKGQQNRGGVAFPKYSPKDIWIENAEGTTSKSV